MSEGSKQPFYRRTRKPIKDTSELNYRSFHARLVETRGPASNHSCSFSCGKKARHWAYDHSDPSPAISDSGVEFSRNFEKYIPLCASCHWKFDDSPERPRRGLRKWLAPVLAVLVTGTLLLQGSSSNSSIHLNSDVASATISPKDRQSSLAASTIEPSNIEVSQIFNRALPKGPVVRNAQPNDGVIALVTRTCGDADNWRSVAADNDIVPPNFLVLLNQAVTIDCNSATPADPMPEPAPAPQPAAPAAPQAAVVSSTGGWQNPLPGRCFTVGNDNGFHTGARPGHDGVDIGASEGTPIYAAAAGTVSTAYQAGGAGNYTTIDHGGGIVTVYMHQSWFEVTSGWVNAGDVIGYVGNTGNSFGAHLHLEVHTGGAWYGKVNPVNWFWDHGASIAC